jgi:hypothetical protein
MKKMEKGLLVAFACLLLSTVAFSSFTLAWINWSRPISNLTLDDGSLAISSSSSAVYKYEYPYFNDLTSGIHNYEGVGKVSEKTMTTESHSLDMNIFDPTYLTIKGAATQAGIYSLNTNVAVKFSFSVSYSSPIEYVVSIKRKTVEGSNPLASYYLRYGCFSSSVIDALTTSDYTLVDNSDSSTDGLARATIFSKVKSYAENSSNSSLIKAFSDTATTSTLTFDPITIDATKPDSTGTKDVSFYVSMDYDDTLVHGNNSGTNYVNFYDFAHIGNSYTLTSDFYISLLVRQIS